MDTRMVEFIRALRAAGVRISLAESQDAMNSIDRIGIRDADTFMMAMKATLIKERRDQDVFDYFFPLFFSSNEPPLHDLNQELTPEQQQLLQQAMQSLMGDMDALRELLQQLIDGQRFDQDDLDQMGQMSGLPNGDDMYQRAWFERRMQRQSGLAQLEKYIDQLMDELAEMGMSQEARDQIEQMLRENMQGLSEQMSNYVGQNLAERMSEREPEPQRDLMDIPFNRLSANDIDQLRDEVRRLAARLRSRAAMRQRKAKTGEFDPRRTFRQNMRYGGVPMEMKYRTHHKKPSLVVICDVSTSMRPYVSFLLTLVYELQDQVRRTHSFIFIDDMVDISMEFEELEPEEAISKVLRENPPGYYSTDLGNSLKTFGDKHMGTIDHRTTVIILGDGRNNYNDPRLDMHGDMQRKARRLFWFCPEPPGQWGTGDSDMHLYANQADGVHMVRNLRDLADSVDNILADS